jgi:hypothetical protein
MLTQTVKGNQMIARPEGWKSGYFDSLTAIYFMPLDKVLWPISLILLVVGFWLSGWLEWVVLVLAISLVIWRAAFFWSNNSTKWRRFYNRISVGYARVAGAHLAICESHGIPFDPDQAWRAILNQFFSDQSTVDVFFSARDQWRQTFQSRDSLVTSIHNINPQATKGEIESHLKRLHEILTGPEPSRKVIATKAYMVSQYFGPAASEAFWIDLFKGNIQ